MSLYYGDLRYTEKTRFASRTGGLMMEFTAVSGDDYGPAFVNEAALQAALIASGNSSDSSICAALFALGFLITGSEAATPSDKAMYAEYAGVIAVRDDAASPDKRWTLISQLPYIMVTCDALFSPASQVFTVLDEISNSRLYSAARYAASTPLLPPLFWQKRVLSEEVP